MRRILNYVAIALFLATVGVISISYSPKTLKPIAKIETPNIFSDIAGPGVQITTGELVIYGSGVVVYQDERIAYVLTCYHVVKHIPTAMQVCKPYGLLHEYTGGEVVFVDKEKDLALVKTAPIWKSVASLITKEQYENKLHLYDKVLTFGHPGRVDLGQLTEGYICDFQDEGRLRTSAPVFFGNSGGGMYAIIDGKWRLISIAKQIFCWKDDDFVTHISFGCSVPQLIEFLETYLPIRER